MKRPWLGMVGSDWWVRWWQVVDNAERGLVPIIENERLSAETGERVRFGAATPESACPLL